MIGAVAVACAGCQTHFLFRFMQVDRRHPQATGRADRDARLQMLRSGCNVRNGTGTSAEPLVEPRRDGIHAERAFAQSGCS